MADFRILNGGPKATLIETFDGKGLLIASGWSAGFKSLEEAKAFVNQAGIEVNVSHIFGSSIAREIKK